MSINSYEREQKIIEPPQGLNTANLLKMASTNLKFSPQRTMKIAQRLYMNGDITYPRTETTQYSSDNEIKRNLKRLSKIKQNKKYNENEYCYANDAKEILNDFVRAQTRGIDVGDHPPITPARMRTRKDFKRKEDWDLYENILLHYFSSLSPSILYDKVKYEFEIGDNTFPATVRIVRNDVNCLDFQPYSQKDYIYQSDELKKDVKYKIINVGYEEKKRDNYITESELIEEMEKNHIGTDASIPQHIENIVKRGYVKVNEKDRTLIPTKLGKALIEALESVDKELVLPQNRVKIEEYVKKVSLGENNYEEILNDALKFYKNKYHILESNIEKIEDIFMEWFTEDYYC